MNGKMASKDPHFTNSLEPGQTSSDYSFRGLKELMQMYGLAVWNDENMAKAHQIINGIQSQHTGTQTSEGDLIANHGQVSDYAMIRDQGFSGKKDFMESHGLRLYNDEDVQMAHQIIDMMREFDEEFGDLPPLIEEEEFDEGVDHERRLRRIGGGKEMERSFVDTSIGSTSLDAPKEEVLLDDNPVGHVREGLEGDGIGRGLENLRDVEEGSNTLDLEDEEGDNGDNFDDHHGGDNDYGGADDDGYDYGGDDDDDDGDDDDGLNSDKIKEQSFYDDWLKRNEFANLDDFGTLNLAKSEDEAAESESSWMESYWDAWKQMLVNRIPDRDPIQIAKFLASKPTPTQKNTTETKMHNNYAWFKKYGYKSLRDFARDFGLSINDSQENEEARKILKYLQDQKGADAYLETWLKQHHFEDWRTFVNVGWNLYNKFDDKLANDMMETVRRFEDMKRFWWESCEIEDEQGRFELYKYTEAEIKDFKAKKAEGNRESSQVFVNKRQPEESATQEDILELSLVH
ncbi:hypothetical protein SBOR_5211 [Sclerotinia borealis F-4128]|uniref:Uncharacterized protein n=1 Tax=Sclerotinia borealis (strain F-4128) TaxID=1432307 RepID=W9CEV5_SCLBF|nr:hypothetical protein SBOR_5211 [Sclerotinia borealis F-4128]